MKSKDVKAGELYVVAAGRYSYDKTIMRAIEPVNRSIQNRVTYEYTSKPYGWRMEQASGSKEDVPNSAILERFFIWEEIHPEESAKMKHSWLYTRWIERNRAAMYRLVEDVLRPQLQEHKLTIKFDYSWSLLNVNIGGNINDLLDFFPQLRDMAGELPVIEPVPTGEELLV